MIGAEVEFVATVLTAMLTELSYSRLRDAVITHPAIAEGLGQLLQMGHSSGIQRNDDMRMITTAILTAMILGVRYPYAYPSQ